MTITLFFRFFYDYTSLDKHFESTSCFGKAIDPINSIGYAVLNEAEYIHIYCILDRK